MDIKIDLDGILDLSKKDLEDVTILTSIKNPYKCKVLKLNLI